MGSDGQVDHALCMSRRHRQRSNVLDGPFFDYSALFDQEAAAVQRTHFIVVTIGSGGDLFPFLAVALELRAHGHRVSFLTIGQHAPFVTPTGLDFIALPADEAVLHDPDLWHPVRGFAVVWRSTRPAMERLLPFVRALPPGERCVLLAHPLALPEADLCRALRPGLRIAAAYLAPFNLPSAHGAMAVGPVALPAWMPAAVRRWLWRWASRNLIDPVALPGVNAARAAHGLAPYATLLCGMLAAPDLSLTLFPDWFAPTQPDWPQPLVRAGFPLYDPNPAAGLSPELERFLAAGPAPLVFTHGTGNAQAHGFFAAARAAVQRLAAGGAAVRAVFLTSHREQLGGGLPATILWQDFVPLRRLLPRSALLVHHGGIGTTAEALRAGTPQLVVPLAYDQFDNAARVAALGAGASLPASRLTPPRLTAQLRRLLDAPGLRARARDIAARMDPEAALAPLWPALDALANEAV
jgi:rhamnosyltransferase subunit B